MMQLRPYQTKVLDDLWTWFARHPDGNPIVVAAVGAGKSLMIAALAQRAHREQPGARILVLVHQKELLEQNVDKLMRIWPRVDLGIVSASAGRKQYGHQITYATIGSIHKAAHLIGHIDIILADECHLINPRETGMWRAFLGDLGRYCPLARVIGWTGTDFRGNGVFLTAGKEALFTHAAARVSMRELLDLGFLAPLKPASTQLRVAGDGVRTSGDDYVVSELARITDRADLVDATCEEIVRLAAPRKRWLVFAVTVAHAEHVCAALVARGIAAAVVSAETPKAERAAKIVAFRTGRLRCLVNVAVLTTGFDVPEVDFIALLRATKSPVLYVQIAGRGMRLAGGKVDCLWADFTDTTERLGPVDAVQGRAPSAGGGGQAPIKLCPTCGSQNPAAAPLCVDCGQAFPEPERITHGAQALGAAVLSDQLPRHDTREVGETSYLAHHKIGSPDSLRVSYWTGGGALIASEWVHFDGSEFARRRAETWWARRALVRDGGIPPDTATALVWARGGALRSPARLTLSIQGKYPEIINHDF